jgi:Zn-dependent peptidase ImmA (M78 family)
LLPSSSPNSLPQSEVPVKLVGKRAAQKAAAEIFQRYRGRGGYLPVDVQSIAEDMKVRIVGYEANTDLSGMLVVRGGKAVIVYNSSNAKARQRFTIAHELAHFVLHASEDYVFHRDDRSTKGIHREEVEANAFAAELLMPSREVLAAVKSFHSQGGAEEPEPVEQLITELARKFEVSEEAMTIRLQSLGELTYDTYFRGV